jgi:hypothetical protein
MRLVASRAPSDKTSQDLATETSSHRKLTYCFSQIVVALMCWLGPVVVVVITFPFFETTVFVVRTTLPAFFHVCVVVFALTSLTATVSGSSEPPAPEISESSPSYLVV